MANNTTIGNLFCSYENMTTAIDMSVSYTHLYFSDTNKEKRCISIPDATFMANLNKVVNEYPEIEEAYRNLQLLVKLRS